jgi:hypothetical protein
MISARLSLTQINNGNTRTNTAIAGTYLPAWAGTYACWNNTAGKGGI